MNGIFELRKTNRAIRNQYKPNLEVPIINQVTFRAKSIGAEILEQKFGIHFHFT